MNNKVKRLSAALFELCLEYNCDNFSCFFAYADHVKQICVQVYPNGYDSDETPEFIMCYVDMPSLSPDPEKEIKAVMDKITAMKIKSDKENNNA